MGDVNEDINDFMREIPKAGRVNVLQVAENGKSVTIRHEIAEPIRAEPHPRRHVVHNPESLCQYTRRAGGAEYTTVFVDLVRRLAVAVILDEDGELPEDDPANKNVNSETVTLRPELHPVYAALRKWSLGLKDAIRFLRSHRARVIAPADPGWLRSLAQIRTETVKIADTGVGRDSINGLVATVKVRGGASEEQLVELPDEITVRCPVFVGGEEREHVIMLEIDPKDGGIVVSGLAVDLDTAEIDAFGEWAAQVRAGLEGYTVVNGWPGYGEWRYVK